MKRIINYTVKTKEDGSGVLERPDLNVSIYFKNHKGMQKLLDKVHEIIDPKRFEIKVEFRDAE